MRARDRNIGPYEHDGRHTVHAELHRFAMVFEYLLQKVIVRSVDVVRLVKTAFLPDGLHGFGSRDVEVLSEVRLEEPFAHRFGFRVAADASGCFCEQVRRNTVGRRSVLGFPNSEIARIFFSCRSQPTLRVLRKLFETTTFLRIRAQQETSPLELDLVAILFFDPAQPNGRVDTPRSQIVGPDNEANRFHGSRPFMLVIELNFKLSVASSGFAFGQQRCRV